MKEMALMAALTVFASVASALDDEQAVTSPNELKVECSDKCVVTPTEGVEITKDRTTLTLKCPGSYKAEPDQSNGQEPKIYKKDTDDSPVPLREYCSDATGKTLNNGTGLELFFPSVPTDLAGFYLKCAPTLNQREQKQPCTVHVAVQSKTPPADNGLNNGGGTQQGGSGQGGAPAGVQTCLHKNKSITVRVPEKGSLAQFACESGSTLYPTEPTKVFSKDCRTQETLKDMTRTQTTGATPVRGDAAAPTYTLEADQQPAKKTLCYLCATAGTSAEEHGTAKNYCTIYVESGAGGTQSCLTFIVALALPCVPALFQFT